MPINVKAAQLNTEGLFKLLGGSADDRERFFEILKGITSVQNTTIINKQVAAFVSTLKQAQVEIKALNKSMQSKT